jgi:hypothetical protein
MRRSRINAVLLVALAATSLAACAGGPPASTPPSPDPSGLQAVVVSTSTWLGASTLLVALEEPDGAPVVPAGAVSGRFVPPSGSGDPPADVAANGALVRPPGGRRDLVRFDTALPIAGRWSLTVRTGERWATTTVSVRDPAGVPVRGDAAPASRTPTANDVLYDLTRLTADEHPNPAFYTRSVARAIADGVPFALVLDSAGFLETPACGSALVVMHRLTSEIPSVAVIHAEPYATRDADGELTLDPIGGPARLATWSEEWGLGAASFGTGSVPWVFVVDRDGVVRATFQGVMGSEEIAVALADVAG